MCRYRYTDHVWGHIVAPVLLTDGDWTRLLGSTALLQGCDGHLITWLTEVIRHLHPTGVSARPWPPLPPTASTISQSRFMHMAITHIYLTVISFFFKLFLVLLFSPCSVLWAFQSQHMPRDKNMKHDRCVFQWCDESVKDVITHWFPSLNLYQSNQSGSSF